MNIVHDHLTDAVGMVLASLVEFPVDPVIDGTVDADDALTGIVTVSGDVDAVVVVRCDHSLAVDIAVGMFAMPAEELEDADVVDALGEVTNMTGGSVKALLDGTCRLGLPIVTTGAPTAVVVPGARPVARAVFIHEDRRLSLEVMLADEDAAIERWVDRITGK
jgi:chemotaxis protein CheX